MRFYVVNGLQNNYVKLIGKGEKESSDEPQLQYLQNVKEYDFEVIILVENKIGWFTTD